MLTAVTDRAELHLDRGESRRAQLLLEEALAFLDQLLGLLRPLQDMEAREVASLRIQLVILLSTALRNSNRFRGSPAKPAADSARTTSASRRMTREQPSSLNKD